MSKTGSLGRLRSAIINGVEATLVTVEVYRGDGLPKQTIVGMAGTAVRESLERIHTACSQSGVTLKSRKTTVNLAPASCPKSGTALDLPIALGILMADECLTPSRADDLVCLGELGLDGSLRPVPGVLPAALAARDAGCSTLLVPKQNAPELVAIPGIRAVGVDSFGQAIACLEGKLLTPAPQPPASPDSPVDDGVDLREVVGHCVAKRALELAAAGGHHLLMVGPPGAGKTMLARALPFLLPPLSFDEAVEASAVYSVVGKLAGHGLLNRRPFRAPHHSITVAGLLGGGVPPRPGEISLAHHGVLFLDELPEFRRPALESLRQPLEEASVVLVRGGRTARLPARFQLAAAMNPCPCGRGAGSPHCRCGEARVLNYWRRISGPLLDRIDLFVTVERAPLDDLIEGHHGREDSTTVRERVVAARQRQEERAHQFQGDELQMPAPVNAALTPAALRRVCALAEKQRRIARLEARKLELSARAWHRVLRLARTAADLDADDTIELRHLREALHYREPPDPRTVAK